MDTTSKSVSILNMLAAFGDAGMCFSDIQKLLWDMSHPGEKFTRAQRGWWCTQLVGSPFNHEGLLHTFAVKGADGRWRRNAVDHGGKPWSLVKKFQVHQVPVNFTTH